jgi:apolipoprotein N-acyltransferase
MRVSERGRDLACLIAGLALPLAYAPFGAWPLAFLSQAVLYRCWLGANPGRACRRGWLYGLGMFGAGTSWVQVSIHQFGLPVYAFSAGMTVLFVLFFALYPALVGYAARRWINVSPCRQLLVVLPVTWTLGEWLRGFVLTGFPWLTLGYSQIDGPLAAWAPVLGVFGVSLMTALAAGAVAALPDTPKPAVATVTGIALGSLLLARTVWTEAQGDPLSVTLVQGGIEQSIKWEPEKRQLTLDRYAALTEPHWGAGIVLWPETALPAFHSQLADYLGAMDRRARAANTALLIGIPYDLHEAGRYAGRYYNSIVGLGTATGRYDKRHLVPFGEFLPLKELLAPMLSFLEIPMSDFTAGAAKQAPLLVAGDHAIGASICYEDAFGEEVIDALPAAALLVNVSNDAWFGDSIAPHQHLEMARMRAAETGRYLLRATNNGVSAIIDPAGRLLARSPQFTAHALTGEVRAQTGATPYVRSGNGPVVTILLLGLLLARRHPGERRGLAV